MTPFWNVVDAVKVVTDVLAAGGRRVCPGLLPPGWAGWGQDRRGGPEPGGWPFLHEEKLLGGFLDLGQGLIVVYPKDTCSWWPEATEGTGQAGQPWGEQGASGRNGEIGGG